MATTDGAAADSPGAPNQLVMVAPGRLAMLKNLYGMGITPSGKRELRVTPEEDAYVQRLLAQEAQRGQATPTISREATPEAPEPQASAAPLMNGEPIPWPSPPFHGGGSAPAGWTSINLQAEALESDQETSTSSCGSGGTAPAAWVDEEEPDSEPESEDEAMMDWEPILEAEDADVEMGGMDEDVPIGSSLQSSYDRSPLASSDLHQTHLLFPGPAPPVEGRTKEYEEMAVNHMVELAKMHPGLWEILVGMYFQAGRNPRTYLGWGHEAQVALWGEWEPNLLRQDREHIPGMFPAPYSWPQGAEGEYLQSLATDILNGNEDLFLFVVREWQRDLMGHGRLLLEDILHRAGWCRDVEWCTEWYRVAMVKRMAPGPLRDTELHRAHQEMPRFTRRCWNDARCA